MPNSSEIERDAPDSLAEVLRLGDQMAADYRALAVMSSIRLA